MPELPEVETVVRGLKNHVVGQTIKNVETLHKRSFLWPASLGKKPPQIKNLKIKDITRRGKGIIITLNQDTTLLIHLKMTGQLIYVPRTGKRLHFGHPTSDFVNSMPSKHTRVILELSQGILYFNDQRIFGWVKVLPTKELVNDPFIKKLGPDALEISTPQILRRLKSRPNSAIKAILLDQSVLAGLGNIYVDEVLFESGIRPTRKGKSITKPEVDKTIKAINKILKLGIKHSGTSILNYKTPEGSMGQMQKHLKVYMQDKEPCKICKGPIKKIRLAGRGTHFCRACQR